MNPASPAVIAALLFGATAGILTKKYRDPSRRARASRFLRNPSATLVGGAAGAGALIVGVASAGSPSDLAFDLVNAVLIAALLAAIVDLVHPSARQHPGE